MGASKALTDPKQQKELLKNFLLDKTPRILERSFQFLVDNLDNGDDPEKMKLAHKMAHKFIDKTVATVNKVEVEETTQMSPEIMEAMKLVMSNRRAEKEKKIENADYEVVDLEEATKVRNQVRSGK